jgi:DNA-binding beta-propeller fold protein YncE
MQYGRLQCLVLTAALLGALGVSTAQAGPLAVIANFTDPGLTSGPPWPPGTVTILDTATDQPVGSPLTVGVNPQAVAITPDGKTAVVACSQSSELYFIDLSASPPAILGKLSVGDGTGNTFYPASLAMSPDGQYVAAMSSAGPNGLIPGGTTLQTQTNIIKVVSINDRSIAASVDLSTLPDQGALGAEAAAISSKGPGTIVIVSPSTHPPGNTTAGELYALSFLGPQINIPDAITSTGQQFPVLPAAAPTVAISPDGGTVIVPEGRQSLYTFTIDDTGLMTQVTPAPGIPSGGDGVQSVAITSDSKTVYALNLLPPANITVFQLGPGGALTQNKTAPQYRSSGIPAAIAALGGLVPGGYALPVGSQMLAVTPDGQKLYTTLPYSGSAGFGIDPTTGQITYDPGAGQVEVFQAGKPDPIHVLTPGKNPIAIAIQQQ